MPTLTFAALLLILLETSSALNPPSPPIGSSTRPNLVPRPDHASLVAASKEPIVANAAGISASTINLVKAIMGSGVLSLPVGVGTFSSSPSAIVLAYGITAFIAAISAYLFSMVARVCEETESTSWGEAWSKTVGASSSWVPSSFVALLCASASLQYTMIIGDSFSSVFAAAGLPSMLASRSGAIVSLTLLCTLPLSLLPSLERLKYTSFLGIGGLLYTTAFMCLRACGHYAPGTVLHAAVAPRLQPRFSAVPVPVARSVLDALSSTKVFVLLSLLATSFASHFCAPALYNELSVGHHDQPVAAKMRAKQPISKMPRFNLITAMGFAISAALCCVVMAAGFLTFGAASDAYILNNYAQTDGLAQAARIAIGLSIVCTYPILHQGLRDTAMEAMRARGLQPSRVGTTLVTVGVITALAVALKNLGTVAAVSGALVATSLVYTLPATMFAQMLAAKGAALTRDERLELVGARALAALGVVLAGIGVWAAF